MQWKRIDDIWAQVLWRTLQLSVTVCVVAFMVGGALTLWRFITG
jgi:hypothetical protein